MEIDSGAAAINKLDMPLDQLVSSNRQARRNRRGGNRPAGGRGNGKPYQRPGAAGRQQGKQQQPTAADVGSKILVSNLHFGVTESDLRVSPHTLLLSASAFVWKITL